MGVLTGVDDSGRPVFAEEALLAEPEERIFYKGRWFEGLYLREGASPEDLAELSRFEARMAGFAAAKDAKGRRAFDVPAISSSDDAEWTALDRLSMAQWLERHGADPVTAASLADTGVTFEALDELAAGFSGRTLDVALRWLATGCAMRALVTDIEKATTRAHELVAAVKGFTHMDRAAVPEAIDIGPGIHDTLRVLGSKARGKAPFTFVGTGNGAAHTLSTTSPIASPSNGTRAHAAANAHAPSDQMSDAALTGPDAVSASGLM